MKLFIIYDRKAETLQSFFTADNDVSAIRGTVGAAKTKSLIGDYPAEFELRAVGEVDPKTCEIMVYKVPELIGNVENLIAAANTSKDEK